jgi:hypothetical protein
MPGSGSGSRVRWGTIHSLYTSREFALLKEQLLLERGDVCECGCGRRFMGGWDCIAHHIQEVSEQNLNDVGITLNPDNILLVRHRCHNRIHERFGGGAYRRVYIVWGAPAAGKSAFVSDAARPDDLVVDIDRVWDAVCIAGQAVKPENVKAEVFALRDLLLDRIRTRSGRWKTAWLVGSYPLSGERERLARGLGAELIHIDTAREVCLDRCKDDGRRRQWVEDYWQDYQADPPPTSETSEKV